MAKARNKEIMNIYNKGNREYMIRTGFGKEKKLICPGSALNVTAKVGKNIIEAYPREIVDSDKMTGRSTSPIVNQKAAELAAKEKELEAREAELAAKEKELEAREAELAAKEKELEAREAELAAKEKAAEETTDDQESKE